MGQAMIECTFKFDVNLHMGKGERGPRVGRGRGKRASFVNSCVLPLSAKPFKRWVLKKIVHIEANSFFREYAHFENVGKTKCKVIS